MCGRHHGDLYLLIGPYTYSSAVIAAAPYKYWRRATVIGQRIEEGLTFYGDWYAFDLPNRCTYCTSFSVS
jgi:hypothetical protein